MAITDYHKGMLVPETEVLDRLTKLQGILRQKGLDLAWIENTTDMYYYSGTSQQGVLIIPAEGDPIPFFRKSLSRAEAESPLCVQPFPGSKGLLKTVSGILSAEKSIGMLLDVLPASRYLRLREKLEGVRAEDISFDVRLQRSVKSEWEQEQIKKAARDADMVFSEIPGMIKPGMTELALTGLVESRLRELGHGGALRIRNGNASLAMIMAVSGNSALYPTNFDGPGGGEGPSPASPAGSGWKIIQQDETVMLDIVTEHNGYHSDQTRIFYTGRTVPDQAAEAHAFCLEVIKRVASGLKPGRICADLYREVNEWVQEQGSPEGFMGYGENRVKFFGHGVGLELDEYPIVADRIEVKLHDGMVVAVEPKAFLKDIGAVGIENTYIIGQAGASPVNTSPAAIQSLG